MSAKIGPAPPGAVPMSRRASLALLGSVGVGLGVSGCQPDAPVTSPAPAGDQEDPMGFTNPVFDSNFPDPMIVFGTDGSAFAYATNGNGSNVQVLTSTDLVTWEQAEDALPTLPEWSQPGKVWAPEVAVHDQNRSVLYYTTIGPDPSLQAVSVAVAEQPQGPYRDTSSAPLVFEDEAGGSIDASPFTAADRTRYLYWKNDGNAVGVDTWISAAKLSDDGMKLAGPVRKLIKQTLAWEGDLVEAPFGWEVDGVFHLFYSANSFASADYAVGHAAADSPLGPFTKDDDPILVSSDVAAGPGHCSLFEHNGSTWMVYHAWAPDGVGSDVPGRTMWLSEITFDGTSVTVEPPMTDYPTSP